MPLDWLPYVNDVPAVASTEITALEDRLGIMLPDDYRRVLIAHQGMAPSADRIKLGDGGTAFGPLLFVGGRQGGPSYSYSIAFAVEALKEWKGVTDDKALGLFPMATNTASGYFCLDYTNSHGSPKVVFVDVSYDHDERGAITPVSESFTRMVLQLY